MRTLVDIPETQIDALDSLAREDGNPRAVLIRKAIEMYLKSRAETPSDDAFGLWGDRAIDGLEYQKKMREEW